MMRRPTSSRPPGARWRRGRAGGVWLLALVVPVLLLAAGPSASAQQPPGALGRLRADLRGQEVLPAPGPPDAQARLAVDLHEDQVCWEISWVGVQPTAAHLYRGGSGEVGPVVIGLFEVQDPLADQDFREGCTGADRVLLRDLSQRPEGYYAQLRSSQHPDGAARGQLDREGQLPHTGPVPTLTPLTQVLLVVLVGGALLLGPLVDRSQQRRGGDDAERLRPSHLHAAAAGRPAAVHAGGGRALKGLLASGLVGLVGVPLVMLIGAAGPLPSGAGGTAESTGAWAGRDGNGGGLVDVTDSADATGNADAADHADHQAERSLRRRSAQAQRSAAGLPRMASGAEADVHALLTDPRLRLSEIAQADLERTLTQPGWIDARVLALLGALSREHRLTVGVLRSGHSTYVKGTHRVSNHVLGRAVDISEVDGQPVSVGNEAARVLVAGLLAADGVLRPDEVGSPFAEFDPLPGAFTDPDHQAHIHIGYDAPT